jgi:pimeloyl-ACP methyl ester carboxylesterase
MTTATRLEPRTSGRVEANGVEYYYELHGQGEPLLLLHGGLGSIDMFGPVLPMLAEHREVVGVDLQGHGRTPLGDREIDPVDMGDDMAVILEQLGYEQVDVMGYSLGGGVAFRLAVQHPGKVRRLVLVSTSYSPDGLHPGMRPQPGAPAVSGEMADAMKGTPMYESYIAVAPHPEDFPKLLDRIGEFMSQNFDWSGDIAKLTMPVMLVYGDSDMFRPDHIVDFYRRLGGGLKDAGWQREHQSPNRLAILPDLTHYDVFLDPDLARTVLPFLEGKRKSHSWAEQAEQAS